MTLSQPTDLSLIPDLALITPSEAARAQKSSLEIKQFLGVDRDITITIARQNGERLEATIPAFALQILGYVLNEVSQGKPVTLIPPHAELTTSQAAEILHVSRPHVIKMLEQGLIPYRKVGTKRRIRYEDIRAYLETEKAARRETLKALAAHDQEIGLYDLEDSAE
jgi:excisionase family DNA binding protein